MMILDLIFSLIIAIIIFLAIWRIGSQNLTEPFNLLSTIFSSLFSGMTIYTGLASIWYSLFASLPYGLTTVANENVILLVGGICIIAITLIMLFRKEILTKRKFFFFKDEETNVSEISFDTINYCYAYNKYKKNTDDPELNITKLFKDRTMQVYTKPVEDYLNKELLFCLKIKKLEPVEGKNELIPSKEIAVCKLENLGQPSIFKIIKWNKIKEYEKEIKDLMENKNLDSLKPFINLKSDYLAEKSNLQDLENVKKSIAKLKKIQEGE